MIREHPELACVVAQTSSALFLPSNPEWRAAGHEINRFEKAINSPPQHPLS